jgi:putative Holliday junction resolvase
MSILALDYGTVRIGLAYADSITCVPLPLPYLKAHPWDDFAKTFVKILRDRAAQEIIVGVPRNMDGSYGESAQKVREFISKLRKICALPIHEVDERWTTSQAARQLRDLGLSAKDQKNHIDSAAAVNILQTYLDRRSFGDRFNSISL